MKENYQTFRTGNNLKAKIKNTLFGLATMCCINSLNAQSGAALNVDGVNDYVVVPNNTGLQVGAGNFTVEFWAKASQVNGLFHYVVTKDNTNSNMEFLVGLGSNDKWFCNVKGLNYIGSTNFVTPNVWYHVACTYDGATEALYVNGVLQGTVAVGSTPLTSPADILIGGRTASSPQQFFAGDIDEVRIWNYARTACQINTYMNCEIATSASGLVANYHFNQGVAGNTNTGVTSLTDASGNSNTGTLVNSALAGTTSNWVTPGGVVSGFSTPAPLPTIAVNSGTISVGSSFTMVPSGGVTYTYTPSGPVVTPTTTSSYTVSGTASTGCTNTAVSTVAIQAAALNVDGVNDYVVVPNNTPLQVGAGNFTVEFWAKASQVNGQFHYVVTKDNTNSNMEFLVGLGSNDKWFCNVKGLNYIGSTNFVTPNVWYHVACTYDGATEALYVNGVLQGTVAVGSTPLTSPADILIGGRTASSPQQFFAGDIDEVRIWNYARTACQISSYMNYEIGSSAAGLLANYHFNQGIAGSTNAGVTSLMDASGNSNTGTLTNFGLTNSTSNWVAPGAVVSGNTNTTTPCVTVTTSSSGLNGDGINDRVAIPHSPSLNVENAFTLECWFNTNELVNETNLMEKGRWAGNWLFFIKPKPGHGTTICMASWAWGPVELWGTTDLQTNTWYHFAATWDGTTRKVYLNGVLEASDVPSGDPIGNSSELGLGAASGGSYEFNGTIDDARIWNVVRTPAEIAANYNTELTGSESGLVAYYKFDNATAYGNNTTITTVTDLTANHNDGALTNYALTGCSSNFICGAPALGGSCIVPAIVTPSLATVTGNCLVNVNSPTTTDACATVTFTGTTSSATTYTAAGTYTVNWSFDDGFGATANATQTIVVNAPSLPVISISEMPAVPLNVAFGGTATASTIYGTNYPATAFDNDTITEGWGNAGGSLPDWLEYDFGTGNAKTLVQYSFYCASTMQGGWGSTSYDPSAWTFEGYNGTTWDVLDSRTDNAPVQNIWNTYTFTNTVAYQKYRINISQSPGNYYAFITELRLFEAGSGACQNKTFTSSVNSFATPANYQWQVNGTNVGSNSSSLSLPFFFINDVVTCDINTANTCVTSSVATSNQVVLTSGAVANITNTIICTGESVTYGSNTYSVAGVYTSTFTAASGCDSIVGINVTVNACTGIKSLSSNASISIYPNPNNGLFYVELLSAAQVVVVNTLGEVIISESMEVGKHNLDIHHQSTGIYFVKVIQDGKQHVIKLIKE